MAGRFRGAVGKLSRPQKSRAARKAKGKQTVALVRRAPKLSSESLQQRIAELTGAAVHDTGEVAIRKKTQAKISSRSIARATASVSQKPVGKAAIEIVGRRTEKLVPKTDVAAERTPAEAMGLKLLHRAVKDQSHKRLLPHQNRHDYEYRLRSVATAGVVRLFNSLAQARKAGVVVETEAKHMTADKVHEKKQLATKEAFLAALRQPRKMERY
ncbi:hypothetical protein TraAM80_01543 [Trypanosoma rangeli]|uniref:Rrp15p-domain-containing protein n=1 Tax=Trypanosoma rangeli TaxID=5698 RepID=A0A3R7MSE6_TRYRA|nr:uncharacterized protein TraAM80_01543 [Trypanosoma rangeli]RNF10496.1 hypothetical protein TraAM80_01543 [Trypanosoma rangeli]|eukprot:RNF10496.1 hypothetical protein TraAM80_01543 [Trypanosoma rangeli]